MKRKIIFSALSVAVLFLANSCAPSTPTTRIAQNPALFESLSTNDKALSQQGQIKRGMHKNGVLIAWGKPDGLTAGSRNGKSYEKWVYTTMSPIYTSSFQQYASYGYGRYGRHGYHGSGYGIGYGPEVYYVQQTAATVEFDQNSKVTDWVTRR